MQPNGSEKTDGTGQAPGRGGARRIGRAADQLMLHAPGMRIIKTALAIGLCLFLNQWLGLEDAIQAPIAAIVCLGQDMQRTWKTSLNRVLGSLFAGIYAYGFLWVFRERLQISETAPLYILLVVLFSVILMWGMIQLKKPGALVISAIVFVVITMTVGTDHALYHAANRVACTLIGVAAAIAVNWLPPLNWLEAQLERLRRQAAGRPLSNAARPGRSDSDDI